MHIRKKINLPKYFLLTLLSTLIACLIARNNSEIIGILIVYAATIINHWMLVEAVSEMLSTAEKPKDNGMILILFIGKVLVLVCSISLSVHLMGNRIIIPVLNYVIQIFMLGASLRRNRL